VPEKRYNKTKCGLSCFVGSGTGDEGVNNYPNKVAGQTGQTCGTPRKKWLCKGPQRYLQTAVKKMIGGKTMTHVTVS
jgi:hypothetical protein